MLLIELAHTSADVAATPSRTRKVERLAELLSRLRGDEIAAGVSYLTGRLHAGRIGVAGAALQRVWETPAAREATLSVLDVVRAFDALGGIAGAGAARERAQVLQQLWSRATREEQDFLARLVMGELRQGALEGVIAEAIARAAKLDAKAVRRASMLAGDVAAVAAAALQRGAQGLAGFRLELMRPVQPMLAQPADDTAQALAELGRAAFEYKMDGARVQLHKRDDEVRVFSRGMNEVTEAAPEIVEIVRDLPARSLILDGEALTYGTSGLPYAFQTTMRRFGRKLDVEALRDALPLKVKFFDCLHADGRDLVDLPYAARSDALAAVAPEKLIMPRLVTEDEAAADAFMAAALREGHEGLVAKALHAPYEAGSRGRAWLKIKRAHTLDLVVLAAEWGNGRRRGWLSNLHLGARGRDGAYVMLGKTFKGLTDELLRWQTQKFLELEIARDAYTVYLRPELVVEIAFNDIQASPRYPGGFALRFARVKRYRPDKSAADADDIETVRMLYARQLAKLAPI